MAKKDVIQDSSQSEANSDYRLEEAMDKLAEVYTADELENMSTEQIKERIKDFRWMMDINRDFEGV